MTTINTKAAKRVVTFKVEQNEKYKDFRVVKYVNGVWENEWDGNWTKSKATKICKQCKDSLLLGFEKY